MSPILAVLLALLLAQEAPQAEAPAAESPAADAPAPAAAEPEYPIPAGAPSDDYGLVAWCYGALSGHIALYDKVIGDVEEIEVRVAQLPGAPAADMASYKTQREAGKDTLKQFRRAMEAAEKASPRPIAPYGAENLRKGGQLWSIVRDTKDKKYLAREWMSWGLPGRCLPTAEKLEARSALFGQALTYNVKPAGSATETPPPAEVLAAPSDPFVGAPVDEETTDPAANTGIEDILPGDAAPAEIMAEAPADEETAPADAPAPADPSDPEAAPPEDDDAADEEAAPAEAQDPEAAPAEDEEPQLRGPQD